MPPTTHQRRQIKALAAENLGIQAIGRRVGVPRGEVKVVLERLQSERQRFTSPDLPGVSQITDCEADLAADQSKMSDMDERFLTARVYAVAKSIRQFHADKAGAKWEDDCA